MNDSTIGIKIADGTYYPVIESESTRKKKLVLTTVNDDQDSVQIDLYRGEGEALQNAQYVGSILIEDIMPAAKGEPEIELIVGIDENGTLNAEAGDTGSDAKQSLSVSLEAMESNVADMPDFEIDDSVFDDSDIGESGFDDIFPEDASADDSLEDTLDETPLEESCSDDDFGEDAPRESKKKPFALIVIIILILLLLGLGAFLFIRSSGDEPVPPLVAEETKKEVSSPEPVTPELVAPAPAEVEPVGPAAPEPEPEPIPEPVEKIIDTEYVGGVPPEGRGGGVWYRLKWGDTLWNLSVSFYRTPWLYGLIAVENDIKNPDVIYAGTDIFIPEN